MHGGTIEATSEGFDKGSTFTVASPSFERHIVSPTPISTAPERDSNGGGRFSLKGLRILAIDDEPDVRDMLQTLLEDCGANVLTAASAKAGLEALAAWKPHVLISISECLKKTATA